MQSIRQDDLPFLYRSADRAAIDAQFEYLTCVRATLILLILGAVGNIASLNDEGIRGILVWSSAVALLVSVVLSFVIRVRKRDQIWFAARALAESVKTLSWRYMTGAEPYAFSQERRQVDAKFTDDLGRIIRTEREVFGSMPPADSSGSQITAAMTNLREARFEEQLETYIRDRIANQQKWYAEAARSNAKNAAWYFWATVAAQLLAVVFAFRYASDITAKFHPAPFFAAVATALIAWVQVRRHDELAKAYSLASHELSALLAKAETISNRLELADFVQDAENAISREHTMWLARRDSRGVS